MRFRRQRHVHKCTKRIKILDQCGIEDTWIEECSCGMRRFGHLGWGRAQRTTYSRWYDICEIDKIKRLFKDCVISQYRKEGTRMRTLQKICLVIGVVCGSVSVYALLQGDLTHAVLLAICAGSNFSVLLQHD